jgi:type I restriction enzyme R subunit
MERLCHPWKNQPPAPGQIARIKIDALLAQTEWVVQDHKQLSLHAGRGVAVREFALKTGAADYLLYVEGKAVGIVEAKPEGHSLIEVESQSSKCTLGLPEQVLAYRRPLVFAYEPNGTETRFTSGLDPEPTSREVFTSHRPEELRRLADAGAEDGQDAGAGTTLRGSLQALPELVAEGL